MAHLTRRRIRLTLLGVAAAALVVLARRWKETSDRGGQQPVEPFRIAGNFYYVGANDVAAFLLTSPQGHVLIDGGYPGTPPLIMNSIAKLGFDIRDVKVLLNSEPHLDHAGGLGALQKASGAEVWASAASADVLTSGGDDVAMPLIARMAVWIGAIQYPKVQVQHVVKDGDTVRLGPNAITAHITPGHTRGCTSWTFRVREGDRDLDVVSACSLVGLGFSYEGDSADFERTFRTLRALPADIWVTSHGRLFGRYRKFAARDSAKSPADPFIDRSGYLAYIDSGEARLRRSSRH